MKLNKIFIIIVFVLVFLIGCFLFWNWIEKNGYGEHPIYFLFQGKKGFIN